MKQPSIRVTFSLPSLRDSISGPPRPQSRCQNEALDCLAMKVGYKVKVCLLEVNQVWMDAILGDTFISDEIKSTFAKKLIFLFKTNSFILVFIIFHQKNWNFWNCKKQFKIIHCATLEESWDRFKKYRIKLISKNLKFKYNTHYFQVFPF